MVAMEESEDNQISLAPTFIMPVEAAVERILETEHVDLPEVAAQAVEVLQEHVFHPVQLQATQEIPELMVLVVAVVVRLSNLIDLQQQMVEKVDQVL
jgi:hypothetical protein